MTTMVTSEAWAIITEQPHTTATPPSLAFPSTGMQTPPNAFARACTTMPAQRLPLPFSIMTNSPSRPYPIHYGDQLGFFSPFHGEANCDGVAEVVAVQEATDLAAKLCAFKLGTRAAAVARSGRDAVAGFAHAFLSPTASASSDTSAALDTVLDGFMGLSEERQVPYKVTGASSPSPAPSSASTMTVSLEDLLDQSTIPTSLPPAEQIQDPMHVASSYGGTPQPSTKGKKGGRKNKPRPPSSARIPCTYPDCSSTFSTPAHLRRHAQKHQLSPLLHMCRMCGRGFARTDHLGAHMRRVHL
ncbi:hypothetical protein BC830DRAFT_1124068, partial [Chytriomyces sp. MP71]